MKPDTRQFPAGAAFSVATLWIGILGLAYFLAHALALRFPDGQKVLATIWPAGGIGLAGLLLIPRRRWPALLLVLFLAGNSANLLSGRTLFTSLGLVSANLLESLACAALITALCGSSVRFLRVKEVLALMVSATAVNACTALLGAGTVALTSRASYWGAWETWWVSDGLGILLVAPLVVSWSDFPDWSSGFRWGRSLEAVAFLAIWCAAVYSVFQPYSTPLRLQPYVLIGMLTWPAFRLGQRGVTLAIVTAFALAAASQAVSTGPLLWGGANPVARLLALQVFVAFAAATAMLLAASCSESNSARMAFSDSLSRLQALGDNLPRGMVYQMIRDLDGTSRYLYVSSGIQALTGVSAEEAMNDAGAVLALVLEEDLPALTGAEDASARNLSVLDVTLRMRRRDGQIRWMVISSKPHRLPDGRVRWDGLQADVTERKQAEEALRKSEDNRRNILQTAMDGYWHVDLEGRLLEVNDAYCRMSGYRAEELLAMRVSDLEAMLSPGETVAKIRKIVEQGADRFESRHRRKDGSIFDVETVVQSLPFDGGRLVAFLRDITERKRSEQALRDSEARVRLKLANILSPNDDLGPLELEDIIDVHAVQRLVEDFYEITGLPVGIINLQGKILVKTAWQEACTKYHRANPETRRNCVECDTVLSGDVEPGTFKSYICKNNLWDVVTPITVGGEHVGNLLTGQFFYEDEVPSRQVFVDQARRYGFDEPGYLAAVDRIPRVTRERIAKAMGFFMKFAQMISALSHSNLKLAKAAEALRESEVRFSQMAEQSGTITWEVDEQGFYTYVSPVSETVWGYRPDDLVNRLHFYDTHPEEGREEFRQATFAAFQAKQPFHNLEHAVRAVDGRVAWVSTNGMPLLNGGGKLRGYRGSSNDVTGRKRAEKEKEHLQSQLAQAQKMESVGRLAGGVAHDFNNLLTVINGYSGFLCKELPQFDERREYAVEIGKAGARAASLTNQLLAFSRKQAIVPRAIDLNGVVADAERMLQRVIGDDIELVTALDPLLGPAMADPDQIHQVIMNLAVNARDAMPDGGRLEISTAEVELDASTAARHPDAATGRYVLLTVTDNGTGMTEEVQQRIFEPFFTTKPQGKGTGLGLATAYGISRQSKGWIDVQSRPGLGSAFRVYLPRTDVSLAKHAVPAPPRDVQPGHETVLVVEDQESVRRLVRAILKARGYLVLEAANSEEAHTVSSRHPGTIHLLLTDVVMPGTDGRRLSDQLRVSRPGLQVILMSGYSEEVVANRGKPAPGLSYLQKPFHPDALAARVREALAG